MPFLAIYFSNWNVTTKPPQAKLFPKAYQEIEAQRIISNYGSNSSTLSKLIESLWFIDELAYQNILTAQMSSMSHQCHIHFAINIILYSNSWELGKNIDFMINCDLRMNIPRLIIYCICGWTKQIKNVTVNPIHMQMTLMSRFLK